jgi:hypothetical protein
MVEYTDIQDNADEIIECIVNCETEKNLVTDEKKPNPNNVANSPVSTVKIVAEMPDDKEMRENLQEMKENDGYSNSCGINPQQ